MRIAVMGAGAVGGYLGARLAAAGLDVYLVARGPHLEALRRNGLQLRSVMGNAQVAVPATADPHKIGPVDYVLFCVKSTDTNAAAASCLPLIGPDTVVISFQNGIDNEERIAAVVGRQHTAGGGALIISSIAGPGLIEHIGGPTRFFIGELDRPRSERLDRFVSVCQEAKLEVVIVSDIHLALWQKFTNICALAGATAAIRLPLGEIRADPAGQLLLRGLLGEACGVARALSIAIPKDLEAQHLALYDRLEPNAYSSLYYDMIHGKPMELSALHGTLLRLAEEVGLDVPWTRAVHAVLSPWARRNLGNA